VALLRKRAAFEHVALPDDVTFVVAGRIHAPLGLLERLPQEEAPVAGSEPDMELRPRASMVVGPLYMGPAAAIGLTRPAERPNNGRAGPSRSRRMIAR
jgi:hypothetical protein